MQYVEYVRWQAVRVASGMQKRRTYWEDWLSKGEPPPWSWPSRKEPAVRAGFESLPTWARLSPEQNVRLQAFCRTRGVTVYIAILTAYLLAVRQYTGCPDLTIGTTYSDRDDHRFASMIGASIVVPALRVDMSDNPDFVAISKAYGIHAALLGVDAVAGLEAPPSTVKSLFRFLQSPGPELLVFECPKEANVYPMVPAGAALSEMVFEED